MSAVLHFCSSLLIKNLCWYSCTSLVHFRRCLSQDTDDHYLALVRYLLTSNWRRKGRMGEISTKIQNDCVECSEWEGFNIFKSNLWVWCVRVRCARFLDSFSAKLSMQWNWWRTFIERHQNWSIVNRDLLPKLKFHRIDSNSYLTCLRMKSVVSVYCQSSSRWIIIDSGLANIHIVFRSP